jgi:ER-bound oxygenase mpaB/B'/Rubber oxygenase, catalytic domain
MIPFHSIEHGGRFLSPENLEPYRFIGDPPLDDLLNYMDQEGCPLKAGDDLFSQSSRYPPCVQEKVNALRDMYSKVPSWVDTVQLERGQKVFLRYMIPAVISLYYRSLVAGFSIPKIAAVIQSTAYLAPPSTPEQVAFRIVDTFALLSSCMRDISNLVDVSNLSTNSDTPISSSSSGEQKPPREAWHICLYVRILHAKVRRLLLKRKGIKAWNTSQYGIPINQEDMSATLLAFSRNTLWGIELLGGIDIPDQDKIDYIALWRYIGWLLGIPVSHDPQRDSEPRPLDPCGPGWIESKPDCIAHSTSMLQSIILHLMQPDESSVRIAQHLLKIGRPIRLKQNDESVNGKKASSSSSPGFMFYFRAEVCRTFIGHKLADALCLPRYQEWYNRVLIYSTTRMYLWTFRIMIWISLSGFQRTTIERYASSLLSQFHSIWTVRHPSRMAEALQASTQSCCPFAMLARE